jgi:hypothetical protein
MSRLPKMMLGFVVRRCAVDLGRAPTAAELAAWANGDDNRPRPFGRSITEGEAQAILNHQSRLVSAQSASTSERHRDEEEWTAPPTDLGSGDNVVDLFEFRERRAAARLRRWR